MMMMMMMMMMKREGLKDETMSCDHLVQVTEERCGAICGTGSFCCHQLKIGREGLESPQENV
jgi:hypothetical protein